VSDYQGADVEALEDLLASFCSQVRAPVVAQLGPVGQEALG